VSSSNPLGRAISVQNYERRTPPISRLKRRQGAQQFRLRSDDANFLVGDLDALSQRAQMIAAVAAIFQPDALVGHAGEGFDHIRAESLIAGMIERGLGALGIRLRLVADGLEASDALFQVIVVQIGQAGFDGVVEPVEPLVGSRRSAC
jgi:hypothetical protein